MMSEEEIYRTFFYPGSHFAKWKIVEEIGSGATGRVFLAFMETSPGKGSYAALKIIPANRISVPCFQAFLKQEYNILANLDGHVNIVKLLPQERHSLWKGDIRIFYMTLEYCPGGSLEEFRQQYPGRRMPADDVFLCLEQVVRGCQYAHEKNVIHGDLCAENILLMRPNNLKITDFGLSRIGESSPLLGTRMLYQAPETIENSEISPATDVWALGILAYRLLTGNFPFQSENEEQLIQSIRAGELEWPNYSDESCPQMLESLKYFTKRMLCLQARQRPSCRELYHAMQRSRRELQPAGVAKFEERFLAHIESRDKRSNPEIVEILDQGLSAPMNCTQEEDSFDLYRGLRTIALCIAILGVIFFIQRFYRFGQEKPQAPGVVVKLSTVPSLTAVDRFALNVTLSDESNPPKASDFKITLYYKHERGFEGKSEPGSEIYDSYIWQIPKEWPDGKIDLWAEARSNDRFFTSNAITLKIKGIYQDRRAFKKAGQMEERLKDDNNGYERIVESYRDYCLKYPRGIFKEIALRKLRHYDEQAARYRYHRLDETINQTPAQIKNILAECNVFLEKYKDSPYSANVMQIISSYRKLLVSVQYQITLVRGSCQSKYADSYVKVYKNGRNVYISSIAKNRKDPVWNDSFSFTWKASDTIKVEFWESDLIKDNRYFCVVDNSVFSIRLLSTSIEEGDYRLEFSSNFPTHLYPAANRKYFIR